jgi:two-component system sensor histidine kinase PilS (NtrC family)
MLEEPSLRPLRGKLLGLMVLRVVLAVAFLGLATWFQLKADSYTKPAYYPIYAIVVTIGLLSIFYASIIDRVKNLIVFTYIQVTVDIVLVTVIVYITGGIESYLSVLYLLIVIGASILIGKRGGYYAAALSGGAYGVLINLDFYHVLPDKYKVVWSPVDAPLEDVLTTFGTNVLAFFTVAYLSGNLAEKTEKIERRLTEKEIDFGRLEALNRLIVDNITSGIMTLDEELRISSFNQAAIDMTGLPLREVYYKDVSDVFPGLLDDVHLDTDNALRAERSFSFNEGEELILGFTVSPGSGDDMTSIVIFQDLTELKALEERLRRDERLKALGELSASIAHEVRNPLASISGSIQVLSKELELSGDGRRLMDIVLREADRLNALITDFLVFAKPAKGSSERLDLSVIIRDTLSVFENSIEANSIKVVDGLEDSIFIEGDARQLSQVFWNLFLNASYAMPEGGRLSVASVINTRNSASGVLEPAKVEGLGMRRYVEVTVSDTGAGIADEDLKKIFDPFFSTKEAGTGLGLALSHRIVKEMGGSIEVDSKLGVGSNFKLNFPLASGSAPSMEEDDDGFSQDIVPGLDRA